MTGFGDDVSATLVTPDEEEKYRALAAQEEKLAFWRDVKLSVVSAVLSGIALYFVMRMVEKRR